ncbi:hypothetical protein NicSoilB4_21660 [Arthrobacter sp. NicSoilB4]|nr:hypothetical protein NicSoilB4_21660 [Arthrobacter sp. NicSoilB4]
MAAVPFGCGQGAGAFPGGLPVWSILSVLMAGGGTRGTVPRGERGSIMLEASKAVLKPGLLAPDGRRYSVAAKGSLVEEARA